MRAEFLTKCNICFRSGFKLGISLAAVMMMMNQGNDIVVKQPHYHPWRPTRRLSYTETRSSRATSSKRYNGSRSHHPYKNSAATSKPII